MVKARIVRLQASSSPTGASASHLRYLQRDGTTRDGERGRLYSASGDDVDGQAFARRCQDDRHQFRFIVAPEDGDQLQDLQAFTRDLMTRMEGDLGTELDWVAVDHFDTGRPHSHIALRGVAGDGEDLVIAGAYIGDGIRARAEGLITLELGPETERERQGRLRSEVGHERWTRLDRMIDRQAEQGIVDVRPEPGSERNRFERILMAGRLKVLGRLGLAEALEPGVWRLAEGREPVLRRLGERGDIIKAMHRKLNRAPSAYAIFEPGDRPVVGKIVIKGLGDELSDQGYVVVDGVDGRAHHVDLGQPPEFEDLREGMIVEVGSPRAEARAADRAIADLARRHDGLYSTEAHLARARTRAVAAGHDPEAYVEAHVRRLEALRRAGIVRRLSEGWWELPNDFLEQAAAYERRQVRMGRVELRVQAGLPLERLIRAEGATWLDRRLLSGRDDDLADGGFGRSVRHALDARANHLSAEGLAERRGSHLVFARNLLETLRRRELTQVAADLEAGTGRRHHEPRTGEPITGTYRRSFWLASGRYALIETEHAFSLVPWRPILERRLGQQITGMVGATGVSWSLGRGRGPSVT